MTLAKILRLNMERFDSIATRRRESILLKSAATQNNPHHLCCTPVATLFFL
jgi:hypothetical protein